MQLQSLLTIGTAALGFAATFFAVPVSHGKPQKLSTTASSNEVVSVTGYQQSKNVSICDEVAAINLSHDKPLPLREFPSDLYLLDNLKKNVHDADRVTLILMGIEFGYFKPGLTPCPDLTLRSRLLSGINEKYRKIETKKSIHDPYRHHKNKTLATRDFEHFLDILGLGHDRSNKTLAPRDWEGILDILGLGHADSNKTLAAGDLDPVKKALMRGWN
ncbi:hypothetical protein BDZ45DRAFT_674190 [Acephala macrosclerotiorum]|nr:hypothetical protein BDZ45DRAFT_674190 [Acephala macrosclerotiorum]